MFTWQSPDGRSLESARVLLGAGGLRALGRSVRVESDGTAFTASYRLVVAESGALERVSVTSASVARERSITLNRTEDGYWLLDTGAGGSRAEFGGAVDVDLEFSPLFNALPVRRLGLHRDAGTHRLPVVFVAVPTLQVSLVYQRYRSAGALAGSDGAEIEFNQDDYTERITVDGDGMVLDYPGLAARI